MILVKTCGVYLFFGLFLMQGVAFQCFSNDLSDQRSGRSSRSGTEHPRVQSGVESSGRSRDSAAQMDEKDESQVIEEFGLDRD